MPTARFHLPVLVAALAALSCGQTGCGQREPARVVETPPPTNERAIPEFEPDPVALAATDPEASSATIAVPVVVTLDERPEGYWSVTADTISNVGEKPAATAAQAPVTGADGKATARTWPTVDAGSLLIPRTVNPGRIDDGGMATGRELWLVAMPMTFAAKSGFERPLRRIDLAVSLGDVVADAAPGSTPAPTKKGARSERLKGDWTISPIKDIGYQGLRYGPNPMPDGPFQYWFRSDQLLGSLQRDDGRQRAGWRLRHADGSSLPAASTWYAVIAAPRGARHAAATVQATMWFTRGDEATVVLPAQRIDIDFHPPAPKSGKAAPVVAPVEAPAAAVAEPAPVEEAAPVAEPAPTPAPKKRTRAQAQ